MKYISTILFLLLYNVVISQLDTIYFDKSWKVIEQSDNASYFRIVHFEKKTKLYEVNDYYISGKLQMKGYFESSKLKVKTGKYTWYFENGNISEEGSYKNGKKDGKWFVYSENGKLHYEDEYVNGIFKVGRQYVDDIEYVYTEKEIMPRFSGCEFIDERNERDKCAQEELLLYLSQIVYPEIAYDKQLEGKVIIRFIINEDGSTSDVAVLKGIYEALDNAAIEHIKNMPKWIPGGKTRKVS